MTLITYPEGMYIKVEESFEDVCKLVNRAESDDWLLLTDADGVPVAVNIGNAACFEPE